MKVLPHSVCMIQHMHVISVRLRSIPLKQSTYLVPFCTSFSMSLVSCSCFNVFSRPASKSASVSCSACLRKRSSESFAFFNSFCRTSHHGLSGAISTTTNMGIGKAHCSPKGILYDHWEGMVSIARRTADAMSCPITQHALTYLTLLAK
jgi:hypothetical protein